MSDKYTTKLGAGLGLIDETLILFDLYKKGMNSKDLFQEALGSGRFPNISSRRLWNIVAECFSPRYLNNNGLSVGEIKKLVNRLGKHETAQIFLMYTIRANLILGDFIREVYWSAYAASRNSLSNEDSLAFVTKANQEGKTTKNWSSSMVKRVSSYLTGACADFGLLEKGSRSVRKILPFRIEPLVVLFLAYDLHFSGLGDNQVVNHDEWALFGLDSEDVLDELNKLMLKDAIIIQSAAGVSKISWKYDSMEELVNVISNGRF